MGQTLSTRVTAPIVAFAGVAVRAFGQQEDAERRLRAALQANGREVDGLFRRYSDFASEMQRTTVVGDETTLAMLQQAESLGLTADSAERAVRNSIAMQSAFGVNAQSAIRYTAALEQGNATMLTRYIPTLRDIEDESERVAEAQRVLGNAFGVAEAEAQGSRGQIIQLKNAVGDLMEVIGGIVSEAILPFVQRMRELAERLQEVDKSTIALGVAIAGVAASIGPTLFIIGKLTAAIAFLTSPIGMVIAAIAALSAAILYIWVNWSAIVERISDWSWWKNMLIDMIQFFLDQNPFEHIIKAYNFLLRKMGRDEIQSPFQGMIDSLETLKDDTQQYEHQFSSMADTIKTTTDKAKEYISGMLGGGSGGGISGEIKQSSRTVQAETSTIAESYEDMARRTMQSINQMHLVTQGGGEEIGSSLSK